VFFIVPVEGDGGSVGGQLRRTEMRMKLRSCWKAAHPTRPVQPKAGPSVLDRGLLNVRLAADQVTLTTRTFSHAWTISLKFFVLTSQFCSNYLFGIVPVLRLVLCMYTSSGLLARSGLRIHVRGEVSTTSGARAVFEYAYILLEAPCQFTM